MVFDIYSVLIRIFSFVTFKYIRTIHVRIYMHNFAEHIFLCQTFHRTFEKNLYNMHMYNILYYTHPIFYYHITMLYYFIYVYNLSYKYV